MSDSVQIIVDREAVAGEAPALAERVRGWLMRERIIQGERCDCVLSAEGGFRPGPRMGEVVEGDARSTLTLRDNGVTIEAGRGVVHAGQNGIELRCARCGHRFSPQDGWMQAVVAWAEGNDGASFSCPRCGFCAKLADWDGEFPWGFGCLRIEFWSWPRLGWGFVGDLSELLGHRVVLVKQHL